MFNKKVITTILASLLACFIIGAIFSEPDTEELLKQMFTFKVHAHKKYDLVVAGDSRIYRGVSTDIVGDELSMSSINLGFSSGGYNKTLFDLIDKKLNKKPGKIIILGISPFSLTDEAIGNGHLNRVNDLKNEEVIEYLYLSKILNAFVPSDPITLWNNLVRKDKLVQNYVQKVHVKEGWVESDYLTPNPYYALSSYKNTFTNTQISQQTIGDLYNQIKSWTAEGFLVFGFTPPSSANMEELERQYSDFDDLEFANGFIGAGGYWIPLKETYTSFDGSHLDSKSARKLSYAIANSIKTKTYLSALQDLRDIKTRYSDFKSKYHFQNNFENDSNNVLISDFAHSGKKIAISDSNMIYIGLYQTSASAMINREVEKVLVDLFVYYEDENAAGSIVFDLNQNGKCILWQGLQVTDIVKPNNWGRITFEISVPENMASDDILKVYFANTNKTQVLIDDFTLDMY